MFFVQVTLGLPRPLLPSVLPSGGERVGRGWTMAAFENDIQYWETGTGDSLLLFLLVNFGIHCRTPLSCYTNQLRTVNKLYFPREIFNMISIYLQPIKNSWRCNVCALNQELSIVWMKQNHSSQFKPRGAEQKRGLWIPVSRQKIYQTWNWTLVKVKVEWPPVFCKNAEANTWSISEVQSTSH